MLSVVIVVVRAIRVDGSAGMTNGWKWSKGVYAGLLSMSVQF
jgi:hypothetical protein